MCQVTTVTVEQHACPTMGKISLDEENRLKAAKSKLMTVLKQNLGSTKDPEVLVAIEELAALNPTKNATESPFLLGEFYAHTSPDFPGRIKPEEGDEDVVKYTLGRLSFGIFQPRNLVCTVRSVRNSVIDKSNEENYGSYQVDGQRTFVYPILIDLTIHTPKGDLPATISHHALAYVLPDQPNRMGVTFRGGSLTPAYAVRSDPALMTIWEEVFDHAYTKAKEDQSFMSSVMMYIFRKVFQLSTPTDDDAKNDATHSVSFDMQRSPRGYLDILYLDEDIRISRGNRGTLVVTERESPTRTVVDSALN